jgi:hypothetical protein
MSTKTKIALSVAVILGTASAALANDQSSEERGGFVIAGSTVGVNPAYHRDDLGKAGTAYGYVTSWSKTQGAKRTNVR